MFGIISAVLGLGLRGVCEVHNYIDNQETMKRTTRIDKNGNVLYFDNDYHPYINGEKVYRGYYKDQYGNEHHTQVGLNSGKVYSDSYDEVLQIKLESDRRELEFAKKLNLKARRKWHYDKKFTKQVTTEFGTEKIIANLYQHISMSNKEYYKEYWNGNEYFDTVVMGDGKLIPITEEEFKLLDVSGGSHKVITTRSNIMEERLKQIGVIKR